MEGRSERRLEGSVEIAGSSSLSETRRCNGELDNEDSQMGHRITHGEWTRKTSMVLVLDFDQGDGSRRTCYQGHAHLRTGGEPILA